MLPNPITERLARAWPALPISAITPTVGGFSHHSALVTIGARRCVLKAAEHPPGRAALRHEARVLTLLQDTGLPAPALGWPARRQRLDDHGHADAAGRQRCDDLRAARTGAARGELAHSRACSRRFINRRCGRPAIRCCWPTAPAGARTAGAPPARHPVARGAYRQPDHPAWHTGSTSLVHGDAGLHNLLWHPSAPALVDWEWAGWGNPHLDLAWVWWTLRWRQAPGALWQAFEQQYHQIVPHPRTPAGALRALALGQIAGILTRVAGQPEAYAEWVRRAAWTLEWDA
ncbi:MAG: phosphotransferase [Kouleothrix sp.]